MNPNMDKKSLGELVNLYSVGVQHVCHHFKLKIFLLGKLGQIHR